jgi:ribosomal protein S18 acetylase RimI-like enzyme
MPREENGSSVPRGDCIEATRGSSIGTVDHRFPIPNNSGLNSSDSRAGPIIQDYTITLVDFSNATHRDAVVAMVNAYASDPKVGGVSLPEEVLNSLGKKLADHPTAIAWLAWCGNEPVGVLVGFLGFSTFAARPLLNIHDLAVLAMQRGQGVGGRLLAAAETYARERGCCALTLETRGDNVAAQRLYRRAGFEGAEQVSPAACFGVWKKRLA